MKTVVIGAIHKYNWEKVKHWWKSLKACGFTGEVHMLCYEIDEPTMDRMDSHGIVLHECRLTHPQVVVSRFKDLAELCRMFGMDTWVVFTDVGDLVFQRNPEEFLASDVCGCKHIVVASEGVKFVANRWTRENLLGAFPEYYDMLFNREYYNAGSAAARAFEWTILAEEVYQMCMARPGATNHDQAAMNIILQTRKIAPVLFTSPEGGWCFNGASSMFAKGEDAKGYGYRRGRVDRWGRLTLGGKEPVMFHHYTRDKRIAAEVRRRVEVDFDLWRAEERENLGLEIGDS